MSFEIIKNLQPYFFSLREINNSNMCLDLKLPVTWKFNEIVSKYNETSPIIGKVQDKNENFILISLITELNFNDYDRLFECAKDVIKTNKEIEEKDYLLDLKIKELKQLFQNESLDKLKDISFIENEKQGDATIIKMVGKGNKKGQRGNNESQEKVDSGN
jgi:hypothetical protein